MFKKGLSWDQQVELCREHALAFSCFHPEKKGMSSPLLKSQQLDKAVFYGGSFNPWHEGHQACLDLCPAGPLIVVPDYNPWKDLKARKEGPWDLIVDLHERLKDTEYSIYPGFLIKEEVTPTVDWLPKVKLSEKYFLMGEDNFLKLHLWKDFHLLLECLDGIYVCPRAADPLEINDQIDKINKEFPQLKLFFQAHHDYEHFSSTFLRKKQDNQ
jgi:nicotinic acid mononucleotide adenylyltransferase